MPVPLTEEDLHDLYVWVDEIPISRPKRNIARDFSDGCCVAEIMKFFFPKLVELHNYTPAMSQRKKTENWDTLNNRVFRKLHFEVGRDEIIDITAGVPGAIELFLRALRTKIGEIKARREELVAAEGSASGRGVSPPRRSYSERYAATDHSKAVQEKPMSGDAQARHQKGARGGILPSYANANGRYSCPSPSNDDHPRQSDCAMGNSEDNGVDRRTTASLRRLLDEKDRTIVELRNTVSLLSEKVVKLEELVRLKDDKLYNYRSTFGQL